MVQNHMLQLLCLVAMEPPYSLEPDVVRNAKMEVLRCLRPITGKDVEKFTARAQYTEGTAHVSRFQISTEAGVNPDSTTETYVALKCFVENWRWSGVPFYLRTGKALPLRPVKSPCSSKKFRRSSSIPTSNLRKPECADTAHPAEEGLSLRIVSRVPGTRAQTHPSK